MCKQWEQTVLGLPDDIDICKKVRSACVDNCIVPVIRHLWDCHINTRGCCCGHGKENPSVVIADGYSDDEIQTEIYPAIAEVDDRDWDVLQWRITKVPKITSQSQSGCVQSSQLFVNIAKSSKLI